MELIFIGLVFLFLNFSITLGSCSIGLIPDFVGYIFLLRGCAQLEDKSSRFAQIRTPAIVMAIYTGVLYGLNLFGLPANWGAVGWVLSLAAMAVTLWITYRIVQGVEDLESLSRRDLQSSHLKSLWTANAVLTGINYLISWVPVLSLVGFLGNAVVSILFLVAFYQSKKVYQGG